MSAKERIARNIVKTLPVSWREQVIHGKLKIILRVDAEVVDDLIAEMTGGESKTDRMEAALREAEKLLTLLLLLAEGTQIKMPGLPPKKAEDILPLGRAEVLLERIQELRETEANFDEGDILF